MRFFEKYSIKKLTDQRPKTFNTGSSLPVPCTQYSLTTATQRTLSFIQVGVVHTNMRLQLEPSQVDPDRGYSGNQPWYPEPKGICADRKKHDGFIDHRVIDPNRHVKFFQFVDLKGRLSGLLYDGRAPKPDNQ